MFNKILIQKQILYLWVLKTAKTPNPQKLLLNLIDERNSKRSDKYVALSNLSMYYTGKNIKKSYNNDKFKISAPIWNEDCKLPDRSCSVSDIQVYF